MDSYKNLEESVWEQGICTRCGACVAVCPTKTLVFNDSSPVYQGNCKVAVENIPCGACYNSCGRIATFKEEKILKVYSAKSNLELPYAQSGGAITSLLVSAIESNLIDGALIMDVDRYSQQPLPKLGVNREQIIQACGSRYSWGNVLTMLGEAVKSGYNKLAIVGTPCVIESVSRIRSSKLDVLSCYGECIRFTIGVFCSGIFRNLEACVCRELKINPWQIRKVEIKEGKVYAYLNTGIKEIPFKKVKNDMLPNCLRCTDFASICADISAGNIGSREGYTTLIIRSNAGSALVSNAVERGNLTLSDDVDLSAVEEASLKKKRRAELHYTDKPT